MANTVFELKKMLLVFKVGGICVLDCSQALEGDKYKVAKRWGHIYIVTKKWFDHCIVRRGIFLVITHFFATPLVF